MSGNLVCDTATLVVHQGALGDWALVLPILRGLGGRVIAVSGWSKARLAERLLPGVTAVSIERPPFSRLHGVVGGDALIAGSFEGLEGIDRVISFVSDGRDAWAAKVRRVCPGAQFAFVRPRPPDDWSGHTLDWLLHQIGRQGFDVRGVSPPLMNNPDGPVVVHPGSGGREKCWDRERFERLMDGLVRCGLGVVPVLGEVEVERWDGAELARWRDLFGAVTLTSLSDLADTIAAARLFVGNDSGPSHLSAQMGVPTVALFGPTSPRRWAPLGPSVTVLCPPRPGLMGWLDPRVVLNVCSRILTTPV